MKKRQKICVLKSKSWLVIENNDFPTTTVSSMLASLLIWPCSHPIILRLTLFALLTYATSYLYLPGLRSTDLYRRNAFDVTRSDLQIGYTTADNISILSCMNPSLKFYWQNTILTPTISMKHARQRRPASDISSQIGLALLFLVLVSYPCLFGEHAFTVHSRLHPWYPGIRWALRHLSSY